MAIDFDPDVSPEQLRLAAQALAKLADEVTEPKPFSWVVTQMQIALGIH